MGLQIKKTKKQKQNKTKQKQKNKQNNKNKNKNKTNQKPKKPSTVKKKGVAYLILKVYPTEKIRYIESMCNALHERGYSYLDSLKSIGKVESSEFGLYIDFHDYNVLFQVTV